MKKKKTKNVLLWVITAMVTLLTFSGCMSDSDSGAVQAESTLSVQESYDTAELTDIITEISDMAEINAAQTEGQIIELSKNKSLRKALRQRTRSPSNQLSPYISLMLDRQMRHLLSVTDTIC